MGEDITLSQVGKSYQDVSVVSDISLSVKAGEFVTLLGSSGSGKTTLLRMIAGFVRPDHGTIAIGGKDVTNIPVHARDIGMVFQNYALFPHLSVAKNVAFPLEMRKVSRQERSALVEAALRLVKLDGYGDRLPRQLSGGQQQRVAFARATVFHPSILLMDEPLGALDRKLREELQLEILRLSQELELTVVFVTHDQSEAFSMSDRIALLSEGAIVQCCSPEEMYAAPVSTGVARFVGEANVFGLVHGAGIDGTLLPPQTVNVAHSRHVVAGLSANEAAVVVRPAVMSLRARDDSARTSFTGGSVEGSVTSMIFGGDDYRVIVELSSGQSVLVRASSDSLSGIRVGGDVVCGWKAEDAIVTRLTSHA
jgi:putative spermidine/putrescine transport system ATP-binding protein